ncbi:hypothetical protein CDL12_12620 [Handroanthus impetiginosus]|uniref:Retrotransposon gag domain-containing protein n=1 Tax=Handroanthus impetiginosus TaxID=429701 RepID=A0A2G9HB52_9LAMI|nr:hypothetical protein CDL12_12620 [Handroanthus impetiginosus]
MANGTYLCELKKEVEGIKESYEQTCRVVEELKEMMATLMGNQHKDPRIIQEPERMLEETQDQLLEDNLQVIKQSSRIEFPKFSGEDLKVKLAAIHLDGEALLWHQVFIKSNLTMSLPSWEEYIQLINEKFGGQIGVDLMIELMHLQQKSSLPPNYIVSYFIVDLREEIATGVETYDPKTLGEIARLVTVLENNYSVGDGVKIGTLRVSLRTTRKISERRSKGLCFNCDNKFTPGHQCKNQWREPFVMEVKKHGKEEMGLEKDEIQITKESAEEINNYQLSTQAYHGIPSFQTLKLIGNKGGKTLYILYILVDCGATHNFFDLDCARRKVTFKGNNVEKPKLSTARKISKLLNKTSQIAMIYFGIIQGTEHAGLSSFSLELAKDMPQTELDQLLG